MLKEIKFVFCSNKILCFAAPQSSPQPLYQALSSTAASMNMADQRRLKYDYRTVISNSHLFYEAQRSGLLPADNRISWRNDSCVYDRGNRNEDLSGGYYTS